jgi:hypothetical protein
MLILCSECISENLLINQKRCVFGSYLFDLLNQVGVFFSKSKSVVINNSILSNNETSALLLTSFLYFKITFPGSIRSANPKYKKLEQTFMEFFIGFIRTAKLIKGNVIKPVKNLILYRSILFSPFETTFPNQR